MISSRAWSTPRVGQPRRRGFYRSTKRETTLTRIRRRISALEDERASYERAIADGEVLLCVPDLSAALVSVEAAIQREFARIEALTEGP